MTNQLIQYLYKSKLSENAHYFDTNYQIQLNI